MSLLVNLRQVEEKDFRFIGSLPAADLGLEPKDESVLSVDPLAYDLQVQQLETDLLVRGTLRLPLRCECVRCLTPFIHLVEVKDWACHIPLEGEEKAEITSDCVDLTPYIRDDIFLAFPRHPLCQTECTGLKNPALTSSSPVPPVKTSEPDSGSDRWAELNKLKL